MKLKTALVLSTLSLALVACQKKEATQEPATVAAEQVKAAVQGAFDLSKFPVSKEALGEFPYFKLPEGVAALDAAKNLPELSQFPFSVEGISKVVAGKFVSNFFGAEAKKDFNVAEVQQSFLDQVTKLGGSKVSETQVSPELLATLASAGVPKDLLDKFVVNSDKVLTYAVPREDGKNVWLSLLLGAEGGAYVAGEEDPTAQVTDPVKDAKADAAAQDATKAGEDKAATDAKPADANADKAAEQAKAAANAPAAVDATAVKQKIDAEGKIALDIRFVTGKTDIDAGSKAQVEQVAQYLKDNADVKFEVVGHTDSTGNPAQNKTLSEKRAQALVSALVAQGIAADRLVAKGLGDTQPIADNATKEGQQQNRRVELVKVQ